MKKVLTITIAFLVLIFGIIVVGLTTAQENKAKEVQPIQSSEKCQLVYIDSTIPVIKPFYTTIANHITENERETLARLVYLEARGQSYLGQKAVVEVVLNRVLSDEFPNTIDDVIQQLVYGDWLIDDGVHNFDGGVYEGILMSQPHNKNFNAEENGLIRVHGWDEIGKILL